MKVHEYQARQILEDAGVPVPPAKVVDNAEEAAAAFDELQEAGGGLCVVKAQVHAGGRGKGGGVKLVRTKEEAQEAAATILSKPLVTHQTGPEGVPVNKLLVAAGVDIEKEYYLGITLDRASGRPVVIASSEGGVEIEVVAEETPDAIMREGVHPHLPLQGYQARKIAYELGFSGDAFKTVCKLLGKLVDIFLKTDADLVEINPLVLTKEGEVKAIDAKMTFDDNAIFRHKDIAAMYDSTEEAESEIESKKYGLSFIQLDGSIGCLVNGAGLAMATMDIIKLHGGDPANFLDVGGSATEEAVTAAFRIILSDPNVNGVLVNIFGGIMQCDKIARAIINAANEVGFEVPLVVRLEGTNVEAAREVMEQAQKEIPSLIVASDLTDAAKKVCAAVNG